MFELVQTVQVQTVRSGGVSISNSYLRTAGLYGNYWSHTVLSDVGYTYYFNFGNDGINSSNSNYRHYGFSLRCLQE